MTVDGKPSLKWDAFFAVVLGFLLVMTFRSGFELGPIANGPAAFFLGAYLQCWGLLFVASYFFPAGSYFLKGLIWLCEHTSRPRGRWTALLWGAFAIVMGTGAMLQGLGFLAL
jgi:hypothetical protein